MRLRYENTMADMLALQEFWITRMPAGKRTIAVNRWAGVATCFGIVMIGLPAIGSGKAPIALCFLLAVLGSVLTFVVTPFVVRRMGIYQTRKLNSAENNKGALGEQEIEVIADGLIARTPYHETKLAWAGLDGIESTSEHTFLFTGAMSALIIPHNRLLEGDYRAFMTELAERYQPDHMFQ
jgi:hypothetical protein